METRSVAGRGDGAAGAERAVSLITIVLARLAHPRKGSWQTAIGGRVGCGSCRLAGCPQDSGMPPPGGEGGEGRGQKEGWKT